MVLFGVGVLWAFLLRSGTNWVGLVVDEGFVHHGVQRVLAGEVPHRDFFFLWTPGILWLHALAQLVTGEWLLTGRIILILEGLALLGLQLRLARDLELGTGSRLLVAALVSLWGVAAWNMPYASWDAILLAWCAAMIAPRHAVGAGITLALSFWFKQNIGLFAIVATGGWAFWQRHTDSGKTAGKSVALALMGVFLGYGCFAVFGGAAAAVSAATQTLLFPFTYREVMGQPLPIRQALFASSLALLAIGVAARGTNSASRMAFVLAAAIFWAFGTAQGFSEAAETLFMLAVILGPAVFVFTRRTELQKIPNNVWLVLAVTAACGLQLYPRFDKAHFVFSFSVAVVPWVAALGRMRKIWAWSWVAVVLAGGAFGYRISLKSEGPEIFGVRSSGMGVQYLQEMKDVVHWLKSDRGLRDGDGVLQVPVTTLFWAVSGFRNVTPHVQFFPGYVEAYGSNQEQVLADYRGKGGRFVILDRWAMAEKYTPELYFSLITGWRETKRFPHHFSIWEPATPVLNP